MIWLWIGTAILAGLALERLFPLRRRQDPAIVRRLFVNGSIAASSYWISKWSAATVLISVSYWVEDHGFGIVNRLAGDAPEWARWLVGLLLLDWSLCLWHRLMHTLPLLWRFHRVHHADPDMDASTAVRFHFGEFFFSNLYRILQIVVLGVPPLMLGTFELLVTFAAIFHHSNFRLPRPVDRVLSSLIATPRIHSIHHSVLEHETRSNYGSLLLIWDRMHGTLNCERLDRVDQIQIGDAEWSAPGLRGLGSALLLPFRNPVPDRRGPA